MGAIRGEFFILQARPITALPDAEAPMPTDWSVPAPTDMYVRASIVEQLPDPLTPLFAEMIDGSVTRSLGKLMNELLVADVVRDGDVGLPTVNGYAYYRYTRSGMARILLRMWPAFRVISTNSRARRPRAVARLLPSPLSSRGGRMDGAAGRAAR